MIKYYKSQYHTTNYYFSPCDNTMNTNDHYNNIICDVLVLETKYIYGTT